MVEGLTPTIVGYLPTWIIYFTTYDHFKRYLNAHLTTIQPVVHMSGTFDLILSVNIVYFNIEFVICVCVCKAAVMAGTCSTIATNPLWLIKTRMMVLTYHLIIYIL